MRARQALPILAAIVLSSCSATAGSAPPSDSPSRTPTASSASTPQQTCFPQIEACPGEHSASPSSASPTSHQTPTATPTRTSSPQHHLACPATPLRGVYHPYRLHVLATCRWFVGTVERIIPEDDGDHHVDVAPVSGYGRYLDADNYSLQHGQLVTEIMPGQKLPLPFVGERVAVFGTWVYDADHGWNEIHPIWAIRYLDTGDILYALPPPMPKYNPDAAGGISGGSGSGGSSGGSGGASCGASEGYYASSYPSAYLIYPASNPDWHDLSPTYLRHFCSLAAAQAAFPGRSVDTDG